MFFQTSWSYSICTVIRLIGIKTIQLFTLNVVLCFFTELYLEYLMTARIDSISFPMWTDKELKYVLFFNLLTSIFLQFLRMSFLTCILIWDIPTLSSDKHTSITCERVYFLSVTMTNDYIINHTVITWFRMRLDSLKVLCVLKNCICHKEMKLIAERQQ